MREPETRGIDLSLEPLDDYVVIQPSDEESETNLGLIIPGLGSDGSDHARAAIGLRRGGNDQADCRTGVITAVGAEAGGVEPGDKVLFPSEAGYDVRLGGAAVKVMRRPDL